MKTHTGYRPRHSLTVKTSIRSRNCSRNVKVVVIIAWVDMKPQSCDCRLYFSHTLPSNWLSIIISPVAPAVKLCDLPTNYVTVTLAPDSILLRPSTEGDILKSLSFVVRIIAPIRQLSFRRTNQ
ncbi:MAG: hypothetical protein [Circular genetic element sp.]|nr:MAG: hypothetical protein [Circular genetic element sp.]